MDKGFILTYLLIRLSSLATRFDISRYPPGNVLQRSSGFSLCKPVEPVGLWWRVLCTPPEASDGALLFEDLGILTRKHDYLQTLVFESS